jgi:hypothetical protein
VAAPLLVAVTRIEESREEERCGGLIVLVVVCGLWIWRAGMLGEIFEAQIEAYNKIALGTNRLVDGRR